MLMPSSSFNFLSYSKITIIAACNFACVGIENAITDVKETGSEHSLLYLCLMAKPNSQ